MSKTKTNKNPLKFEYGSILFGVGILISIVAGFLTLEQNTIKIIVATLVVLGIAIGLLNINKEETVSFLVAAITLVMLLNPFMGLVTQYFIKSIVLAQIFTYLIGLIVPAALIVALKTIFMTAKDN